ncbi:c-type cytochrome [Fluoribacter gormanii]|uniref:Cytochrome c5 n=1 Tax=Fluoribacter gormanii TaxID=464 RepID=A0A377GF90_9GAMM|nr:c-type cytochrome [Fluoribacter gormanii]KTD01669.1 cytochrome c5 [Fluoribacter gormanii]MCW8444953.1 c-type cytochrome [Fluoribacter gormanii]MCW8470163.1 c-type cytochrome [Fluoribacter gormanii]SIR64827.1 Cytochrome c5 [Fluoribacter gormanii]STO23480.1 Cytochrome c5 [Fluoribacter gormanii]
MRLQFLISLFCFSFVAYASDESQQREIQLRIQPVGKVTIQGQAQTDNKAISNVETKEPGQETYQQYCIVCHRDGLAGAPKFRNEQDWKPRLTKRELNDLLASSIKGLNAMPAKGTCIKCSDDDLKAAISYMLPKS